MTYPFLFTIGDFILRLFQSPSKKDEVLIQTNDLPFHYGDEIVCKTETIFTENGEDSGFSYGDITQGRIYHVRATRNEDRLVEILNDKNSVLTYPIKNFTASKTCC